MNNTIWNRKYFKTVSSYPGKPRTWLDLKYTKNMLATQLAWPSNKSQCSSRKFVKKIKNLRIKCIQDYIKWNRKRQNNVLFLNNIRKKNTLPINKAKGDRLWTCIIITMKTEKLSQFILPFFYAIFNLHHMFLYVGRISDAKQEKHVFLNKKHCPKKCFFMFFYYYLQFKGRKVFFNTLECLFMLYRSCKTLHSVCQLHFHRFRDKLRNALQYKSP